MEFSLKGDNFEVILTPSFSRDWNKLNKNNPHLGKLTINERDDWVIEDSESLLRNLINVVYSSFYKQPGLRQSMIDQNIIEVIHKHCEESCSVCVINLEKTHKFMGNGKKIQGEKWPRVIFVVSNYSQSLVFARLSGHEDPDYNKHYDKVIVNAREEAKAYLSKTI